MSKNCCLVCYPTVPWRTCPNGPTIALDVDSTDPEWMMEKYTVLNVYSLRVNVMKPGKNSYFTPKSKDINSKSHIMKMKHIFTIVKILKAHFPSKSHYRNEKKKTFLITVMWGQHGSICYNALIYNYSNSKNSEIVSQCEEVSTMFLQIPFIFVLRVLGYFSVDFGVFSRETRLCMYFGVQYGFITLILLIQSLESHSNGFNFFWCKYDYSTLTWSSSVCFNEMECKLMFRCPAACWEKR